MQYPEGSTDAALIIITIAVNAFSSGLTKNEPDLRTEGTKEP